MLQGPQEKDFILLLEQLSKVHGNIAEITALEKSKSINE